LRRHGELTFRYRFRYALRKCNLVKVSAPTGRALDPPDKRVLTDAGNEIRAVSDVAVEDNGSIDSLETDAANGAARRLRGIGSYAVVVAAAPDER